MLHNLSMDSAVNAAESNTRYKLPASNRVARPSRWSDRGSSTFIQHPDLVLQFPGGFGLRQPARPPTVINMDRAHTLATGQGIVATIDTGADFSHSGCEDPSFPAGILCTIRLAARSRPM